MQAGLLSTIFDAQSLQTAKLSSDCQRKVLQAFSNFSKTVNFSPLTLISSD